MCRNVADAATILSVIAGPDPLDNFTLVQPMPVPDFSQALKRNALKGARLGVPRLFQGGDPNIIASFNASLEIIKELGATIVDPADFPDAAELRASLNESLVLSVDFKVRCALTQISHKDIYDLSQVDINNYIAGLVEVPTGVKNLADLITFNTEHAALELIPPFYTSQSQ